MTTPPITTPAMTAAVEPAVTVLGLVASPQSSARTGLAVQAVLTGARDAGAQTSQLTAIPFS